MHPHKLIEIQLMRLLKIGKPTKKNELRQVANTNKESYTFKSK